MIRYSFCARLTFAHQLIGQGVGANYCGENRRMMADQCDGEMMPTCGIDCLVELVRSLSPPRTCPACWDREAELSDLVERLTEAATEAIENEAAPAYPASHVRGSTIDVTLTSPDGREAVVCSGACALAWICCALPADIEVGQVTTVEVAA